MVFKVLTRFISLVLKYYTDKKRHLTYSFDQILRIRRL